MNTMVEILNIIILNILYYIVTIIELPIVVPVFILAFLYKNLVFFLLKQIYDPTKITELCSSDKYWILGENHRNTADVLLLLHSTTGNFEHLISQAKRSITENLLKHPELYPKVNSTLESFMNYGYLYHRDLHPDDIVRIVNIEDIDNGYDKNVTEIFSEQVNLPLPYNNKLLWELIFLKTDTKWNKIHNFTDNQYPVLLRFNHLIGDGLAVMNLCVKNFADNNINMDFTLKTFVKKTKPNRLVQFIQNFHLVMVTPGFFTINVLTSKLFLCKWPRIAEKKKLFVAVESGSDLVQTVKSLKKEIGNTGFSEILVTAISASLNNYFLTTNERPEYTAMIVIFIGALLEALNNSEGNPDLKNQFSYVVLKLPVCIKVKTLLQRLKVIKNETRRLTRSPELWVHHLMLNRLVGYFPKVCMKLLSPSNKLGTSISNLPGIPLMTLWKCYTIENVFFFPPHRDQLGLNFSIMTYNNRLHLGIATDEATIPSHEASQKLVDDILDNISLLKNEVINKKM